MAEKMMLIPEGAVGALRALVESQLDKAVPHDCPAADERLREAANNVAAELRETAEGLQRGTMLRYLLFRLADELEPPKPAFDVERAKKILAQLSSGGPWVLHEVAGILEAAIREREGR